MMQQHKIEDESRNCLKNVNKIYLRVFPLNLFDSIPNDFPMTIPDQVEIYSVSNRNYRRQNLHIYFRVIYMLSGRVSQVLRTTILTTFYHPNHLRISCVI